MKAGAAGVSALVPPEAVDRLATILAERVAAIVLAKLAAAGVPGNTNGTPPEATEVTEAPPEEPRWMKLCDYARSRSISRRTLDRYITKGFPTKGAGHARKVVVAEADAWLERCGTRD